MHTFTHEKLPLLPPSPECQTEKHSQLLIELGIPEDDREAVSHLLEQLDTIRYSPRTSAMKEILGRIRQERTVNH